MNLVRVSNGAGVGTVPNFDIFAWCFLPREFLELAQTNSKALIRARSLQSCLILCNPMDCSLPVSSIHGILQARILEWVDIPLSWGSSRPRDRPASLTSPAFASRFFTTNATWEAQTVEGVRCQYSPGPHPSIPP